MKKLKVILIGAGNRGTLYTDIMAAMPEKYEVIGVAEPIASRRNHVRDRHQIPEEMCFSDYKDLLALGCVGNVHQSHSFVRGNWCNTERSAPMLLAKSCHDLDILQWLIGKKCKKVQSFGSLSYFKRKNMPEGASEYCIDGCPSGESCPYNAVRLYYEDKENDWFRTTCTRQDQPTDEMVEHAIRTTQYGKCVFQCDNDVVDHQTVNMLFEDDITVTFTMNAFNEGGRFIHIMGTKGEIRASLDGTSPVRHFDFVTREWTEQKLGGKDGVNGGHGGGDEGIVNTIYEYLCGTYEGNAVSDIAVSCENHQIVFAAEYARKNGCIVDFEEYLGNKKADIFGVCKDLI